MPSPETPQPLAVETADPLAQRGRVARLMGRLTGSKAVQVQDMGVAETPMFDAPETPVSENYSAEMTAWTSTLTGELEAVTSKAADNSAKAERSWALSTKAGKAERAGHNWLNDGELVRRGISKRYGSYGELHDTAEQLSRRFNRLNQQLDYAKNYNRVLEFTDDIDPSVYRRFIAEPNQLGAAYNLPETDKPTTNPQAAADQLNSLPFVNWEDVRMVEPRQHPGITIKGHFNFPTERIIGIASFSSWAGRGEQQGTGWQATKLPNGMGGKNFVPRNLPDMEQTSRGAITDYAQIPYEPNKDYVNEARIVIVQDSAGEYWGIATTDGSHRVGAAKLRGESTVAVGEIELNSDEDMYRLDYAVRDTVTGQQ
ncbi:MAG: hypothetical protein QFB87_00280 [Patescibacteria group bacterium]|nr:hypothetical protein [Patescibacteria group bacterium]